MAALTRWTLPFAALAACAPLWAGGQENPVVPTFPTQAEAITVDVVVLDRDGRPLRGLTKADFTVLEDGHAQEIVAFEAREIQAGPAPPRDVVAEHVVSNGRRRDGRVLALVLDDLGIAPLGMTDVRKAVARWLADQGETDDEVTLDTSRA